MSENNLNREIRKHKIQVRNLKRLNLLYMKKSSRCEATSVTPVTPEVTHITVLLKKVKL